MIFSNLIVQGIVMKVRSRFVAQHSVILKASKMKGGSSSASICAMKNDIDSLGVEVSQSEWKEFCAQCVPELYKKKETIFDVNFVSEHMFFVTKGISACQFSHPDGQLIIDRFFEPGDFCATVRSAWRTEPSDDQIVALTPVEGVLIPMKRWRDEYLRGGAIGEYIRIKIFQTLLFDADIMRVKSLNRTNKLYAFLQEHQPGVLHSVAQKDIAKFLGITPEGLSRFLKNTAAT